MSCQIRRLDWWLGLVFKYAGNSPYNHPSYLSLAGGSGQVDPIMTRPSSQGLMHIKRVSVFAGPKQKKPLRYTPSFCHLAGVMNRRWNRKVTKDLLKIRPFSYLDTVCNVGDTTSSWVEKLRIM